MKRFMKVMVGLFAVLCLSVSSAYAVGSNYVDWTGISSDAIVGSVSAIVAGIGCFALVIGVVVVKRLFMAAFGGREYERHGYLERSEPAEGEYGETAGSEDEI